MVEKLLETLEHAQSRGAPIIAELAGAGWSFDAFNETAPDAEQQAYAMRMAIEDAGISPEEVDYINSSELKALYEFNKKAKTEGKRFKLVSVSPQVRSIIELTRLTGFFDVADSEEEALESLESVKD